MEEKNERIAHIMECMRELIEELSGIPRGLRTTQAREIMKEIVAKSRMSMELGQRWGEKNRDVSIAVPDLEKMYLATVDDVIEGLYVKMEYFSSDRV